MIVTTRVGLVLTFVLCLAKSIKLIDCKLCIETEKQALLAVKKSLDDTSNVLSSWVAAVDCCKWEHVFCDNSTGHVHDLHLQSLSLGGTISPSLLNLKHLRFLDLSQNDFAGMKIPGFIGSIVSLEYLNLSSAGFDGFIPRSLGNLSNLHTLGLSNSLSADSVQWLSSLSRLEFLDLNYVNLSSVSGWLDAVNKLPNLIELHLSYCGLDYVGSLDYTNFTYLEVLDLSNNLFQSAVPEWIFHLSNLVSLELDGNAFGGPIPSDSVNMTNLRFLDLSQNVFHSTLPNWLFNCSKLESLSLQGNRFYGSISNAIVNLRFLRRLDLSSNELAGKFPQEVVGLCNLQVLDISFNKLQGNMSEIFGTMPKCFLASVQSMVFRGNALLGQLTDQLGEFKNIQILDLGNNSFTGSIPVSLGRLSSIRILRLDNNKLTGNFPLSFGQLSSLEVLVMENNLLEGEVTEIHFANLTYLSIISASGNNLTLVVTEHWTPPFQLDTLYMNSWNLGDQIPTWLQTQRSISGLDLSCTGISGRIPSWFWNLSTILFLNLSHNQLSGGLPDIISPSWAYLSSNRFSGHLPLVSHYVNELDLSANSFSGSVSYTLCRNISNRANSLTILHLGGNQLSGEIPDCWMNWPLLQVINLGNNNMSGTIPGSLGLLDKLLSLNLYGNALSGTLPSSLQNCTSLIKLDLSGNEFTRNIPGWIGTSLSNLRILILRSNQFTGEITPEICNLRYLHILDVASNKFSGAIPQCLNNLAAMSSESKLANFSREIYYSYFLGVFMESASLATKGSEFQYDTILLLFSSIDLSDNQLSGHIPNEIKSLAGLRSLNLSGNHLTGQIPDNFGGMRLLESLDLSRNKLSGKIPASFSSLNFLSYLNLSFNNLSGKIPVSTQLQSLSPSSFIGNELCGLPLDNICPVNGEIPSPDAELRDGGLETGSLFVSMAVGFAVGLWLVGGSLIFIRSWRVVYFQHLDALFSKFHARSV